MASRLGEPIVERHEGQQLAHLTLQIKAARELHGVPGPQGMAKKECPRGGRNIRRELNDDEAREIVRE
jgi:hypothetical protein